MELAAAFLAGCLVVPGLVLLRRRVVEWWEIRHRPTWPGPESM